MKILTFILTVLSIFGSLVLHAQDPVISADVTQGCDSLKVNFSFATSLGTVTWISWNFGDGDTSNLANPMKNYKKPGNYTVSLKLNSTNSNSNSNFIQVGRTPNRDSLDLRFSFRDTSVIGVYTYVIGAQYNNNNPPYSYQWSIDGVASSNNLSFVHQFDTTGIYYIGLKMTDAMGCNATFNDSINVFSDIVVPNVFTPNGDPWNENFTVNSNGNDVLSFRVFTRTGLLISKIEAKTIIWDGRLPSGEKVLPGIYFYTLETLNVNPPVKKRGFFYIFY